MAPGEDQHGVRPNIMYWYDEGPTPWNFDTHWVGLFRVAVEAGPPAAPLRLHAPGLHDAVEGGVGIH